jgi:hypothetical protein
LLFGLPSPPLPHPLLGCTAFPDEAITAVEVRVVDSNAVINAYTIYFESRERTQQHISKHRIKILHHGIMLSAPETPLLRTYLGRPLAIASAWRIIGTELDALANQHPERDL